jgi:predicted flap endonuclease-1-like 5' DNA nuclease
MDSENILHWLLVLLFGIICLVIGYYWGKGKNKAQNAGEALQSLKDQNTKLKADLEACRKNQKSPAMAGAKAPASAASNLAANNLTSSTSKDSTFDANDAKTALGKRVKKDDLKIVEGIGPKIEGLFHDAGIKTWKDLAGTSANKCQEVLNAGGKRYRIHDPASWPMQAQMAHLGEWKKLAKWQNDHKAGKF